MESLKKNVIRKQKISFGVHIPIHGVYDYRAFLETAMLADSLGYDYVTVGDHFYVPNPEVYKRVGADPDRPDKLDAWSALAALATQTDRVKLGTRVSPMPFYLPGRLAKTVTAVDIISGGRVILGVGAGTKKDEAMAYGLWWGKHHERTERMVEGVEIVRKLWVEDRTTFKGKHYNVVDAPFWPKPVQKPHPPIWFGGESDAIINSAVNYGEGIFPNPDMPIRKLEDLNDRLRNAENRQGRKTHVKLAPGLNYPDGMGRTTSQWLDNVESLMSVGGSLIFIDLASSSETPANVQVFLKDFAHNIFPKFKR